MRTERFVSKKDGSSLLVFPKDEVAALLAVPVIGEQALWSWRGVIKNFAREGS